MNINHLRTANRKALALTILAISIVGVVGIAATLGTVMAASRNPKSSAHAFHDQMRKLWEDHITWTRLVIVSVLQGLPDTGPTVQRLLQNQVDIGNAVKPFYADAAGNQLTALLHDHITIAAEILVAARAGNTTALDDALFRWYANANSIAAFLNSANPKNWPLDAVKAALKTHLDLTPGEAETYLKANYTGSTSFYDQVHLQILGLSDTLSSGIIVQFHRQFTGTADQDGPENNH